jgi:hypothetical protein
MVGLEGQQGKSKATHVTGRLREVERAPSQRQVVVRGSFVWLGPRQLALSVAAPQVPPAAWPQLAAGTRSRLARMLPWPLAPRPPPAQPLSQGTRAV